MGALGALLFLFGTAVVSGRTMGTHPFPPPFEGYGLPGDAPIISFGVPNFYPIEAKRDCDYPKTYEVAMPKAPEAFIVQEPRTSKSEPIVIPEPPALPSFKFTELPHRVAVENPASNLILSYPALPSTSEGKEPVIIPKAPVLPPMVLPEVPVAFEVTTKEEIADIPEAPVLPPYVMPELPVSSAGKAATSDIIGFYPVVDGVEDSVTTTVPQSPILPPLVLSEMSDNDIDESPKEEPLVIPEAPVLPPLTLPAPTLRVVADEPIPIFTSVVVEESPKLPADVEKINSVFIPEAPQLPRLSLSELPVKKPEDVPQLSQPIPEAPVLPSQSLTDMPIRVADETVVVPSKMRTQPYPPPFEGYGLPGDAPIMSFGIPNYYPMEPRKDCNQPEQIEDPMSKAPGASIVTEPEKSRLETIVIPEAPELPPFTLTELPHRVENPASTLIISDPALLSIAEGKEPVIIPKAPILPPLLFSEAAIDGVKDFATMIVPQSPILPPLILSEMSDNDIEESPKEEPIVIPEAPVLPPLTLPEPTLRNVIDELVPIFTSGVVEETQKLPAYVEKINSVVIPEAPQLPRMSLPELPVEKQEDVSQLSEPIPEAPILPTLSLTDMPIRVADETVIVPSKMRTQPYPLPFEGYGLPGDAPIISFGVPNYYPIEARKDCDQPKQNEDSLSKAPGLSIVKEPETSRLKPIVIPAPPELPPFTLIELPNRVSVENPASTLILSDPALPSTADGNEPVIIPKAPVLPPLLLSEVPVVTKEAPKEEIDVINEAPVLPPLVLTELPVRVAGEDPTPEVINCYPADVGEKDSVIMTVPQLPILPPLVLSETPDNEMRESPKEEPNPIPEAPVLPPLTLTEPTLRVVGDEAVPIFTSVVVEETLKLPTDVEKINSVVIPEAPQLPLQSLTGLPVENQEDIHQLSESIPAAPVLPPLSLSEPPIGVAVETVVDPRVSEQPLPTVLTQMPEIPSIAPRFIEFLPKMTDTIPEWTTAEAFINGRSPIIIKAPVQIVIEGGADLARFASPDCIATILRESLVTNLAQGSQKVLIPVPI